MESSSNWPNKVMKIVLLGESGVGKTSIINRYMTNDFKIEEPTTSGASFLAKTLPFPEFKINLKLNLWDTAGQEKFHTMIKIFYRDSNAIALIYAINRRQSFDALTTYWYPEVRKECGDDIIICVVANKADLYEEEEVTEEEGKAFAASINAFYAQTSAVTQVGIENLFNHIGKSHLSSDKRPSIPIDPPKPKIELKNTKDSKSKEEKKKCCK